MDGNKNSLRFAKNSIKNLTQPHEKTMDLPDDGLCLFRIDQL